MSLIHGRPVGLAARCVPVLLGLLLAACSIPAPLAPGASAAEVRQRWGEPTGRHERLEGGTRWEYAKGPEGAVTHMVDFDSDGRFASVEQVLTEPNFATVSSGLSEASVRRKLGRPSEVSSAGLRGGVIWSYRYVATFCQWFQVVFDADRRVLETGFGNDPRCLPKND